MHRPSIGHREALIAEACIPSDTTYVFTGEIVRLAAVLRSNLQDE